MRSQLLDYLTTNLTDSIKPSQELPFEQGGSALYLKNMRRVYLDEDNIEQEQIITTFDNDITQTITTVRGYLAVDAKNRNVDLDDALTILASAKDGASITNSYRKELSYTTTIDNDQLIYEFEYRFYTIA